MSENYFHQSYWTIKVFEGNRCLARFQSLWQAENYLELLIEQRKQWNKKSNYKIVNKNKVLSSR